VFLSYLDGVVWASQTTIPPTTTPPTTNGAGGVITIDGGPNATANIPGPRNDPADLYGIVLVLLAIGLALFATRWLFGRYGPKHQ
jgi:hypothetical protein